VDYPSSLTQFLDWFHSDADCWAYLARLRWADGFSCPRCGPGQAWLSNRHLYICSACERQTSVLAGTIFEKTRLPLLVWFRAIWFVTSSKGGVSAKELQRELGIGYRAAWLMLHKMRLAMKRPGRDSDRLSGDIEVDETYLGGPAPGGKRGRGAEGKLIIAIAVERLGFGSRSGRWALGRTRMQVIENTSAKTLLDFIEDTPARRARRSTRMASTPTTASPAAATPTTRRRSPRAAIRPTSCSRLSIASSRS